MAWTARATYAFLFQAWLAICTQQPEEPCVVYVLDDPEVGYVSWQMRSVLRSFSVLNVTARELDAAVLNGETAAAQIVFPDPRTSLLDMYSVEAWETVARMSQTGVHLIVHGSLDIIESLTGWSLDSFLSCSSSRPRHVSLQLHGGAFEHSPFWYFSSPDACVTRMASLPATADGVYGDATGASSWTSPWGNGRVTFIQEENKDLGIAGSLLLRSAVGASCARLPPVVSCPVYTLHDLGTSTLTELSCLQLLAERVVSWNSPAEMEHALFSGEVRGVQFVVPSRGSSSWLHWFSARAEIANLIAEGGLHLIVHEDIELINVLTSWSLSAYSSCYVATVSPSLQGGGFEQGPPYLYVEGGRRRCVTLARMSSLPAAVDGLYGDSQRAWAWTAPWGSGRITFLGPALGRHASITLLLQSSLAAGCRDDGAATQPLSVHGASQCRARLMDEPAESSSRRDMSLAVPYATVLDTAHEISRVMMSGNETLLMVTQHQATGSVLDSLRLRELEKFVYVTGGHLVSVSVQTINALTNWSLTVYSHWHHSSDRYVPPQLQGGGFEWGPRYLYLPDDSFSEPFSVTETASLPASVDGIYGGAARVYAWTSPWGNGRITFISEHLGVAGTLLLRGVVGDSCARMPVVSCPVYTLHDLGTSTLTELSCLQLLAERVVSWNSPAEMEHALFSGEVRGVQFVVPSRGSSSWLDWFSARAEIANLIAEGGLHLIVHEDIELINVLTNWSLSAYSSCYYNVATVSPSLQGGGFEQGPPYLYVGEGSGCFTLARMSSLPAAVDGLYGDSQRAWAWTAPWGSGRITFLGPALGRHASLALLLQSSLAAGCRDGGAATLSFHGASQCRAWLVDDEPSWSSSLRQWRAETSTTLDMSLATVLDTEHEISRVMMSGNETLLMGTLRQDTGQLGSFRRQELEKFVYVTGGHLISVSLQTINALTNWSLTAYSSWHSSSDDYIRYMPPQLQGGGFERGPRYLYLRRDDGRFRVTDQASLPASVDGMYGDAIRAHAWTSPWGNGRITFIGEDLGIAGALLLRGVVGDSCPRLPVVSCPVYTLHDLNVYTLTELSYLQLLAERVVSWNSPAEMEHALFSGEVRGVQFVVPSRQGSSWLHWFSSRAEVANLIAEGGLHLIVHEDIELINVLTNWSLSAYSSCYDNVATVSPSLQGGGFEQGPPYLYVEGGRRRCFTRAGMSSLPASVDGLYNNSHSAWAWTAPWGSGRITFLGPPLGRHPSLALLLQSSLAAGCRDGGAATQPLSFHVASQCRAWLIYEPFWSLEWSWSARTSTTLDMSLATVLDTEHEISRVMMSGNETLLMGTLRQDTGPLGSLRRQELEKFVYVTGGHLISVSLQTINALTNWSLTAYSSWHSSSDHYYYYMPPQLQGGGFERGPKYLHLPHSGRFYVTLTETASLPASVDGMYGDAIRAHAWTSPWGNGRITFIAEIGSDLRVAGALLLRGVVGDSCPRLPVVSCPVYTLHDLGVSTLTELSYLQLLAERVVSWNSPAEMEHALFSGEVRGVQFVVPSRGSSSWLDWFSARAEIANLIAEGGLHLIVHEDIELINVLTNWSLTVIHASHANSNRVLHGGGFEQGPQYLSNGFATRVDTSSLPTAVDGLYGVSQGDSRYASAWTAPWGSGRITFLGPALRRHASITLLLQSSLAAGCRDDGAATQPLSVHGASQCRARLMDEPSWSQAESSSPVLDMSLAVPYATVLDTAHEISRVMMSSNEILLMGTLRQVAGQLESLRLQELEKFVYVTGGHLVSISEQAINALTNWSLTTSTHRVWRSGRYVPPQLQGGGFEWGPRYLYLPDDSERFSVTETASLPASVDGMYGDADSAHAWTSPWGNGRITFISEHLGIAGSLLLRGVVGDSCARMPVVSCPVYTLHDLGTPALTEPSYLQLLAERVVSWNSPAEMEHALFSGEVRGVQFVVLSRGSSSWLHWFSARAEVANLIAEGGLHLIVHEDIELINVLTSWSLSAYSSCYYNVNVATVSPSLQGGGFEQGPPYLYVEGGRRRCVTLARMSSLPAAVDGLYGDSQRAWAWTAPWGSGRITFLGPALGRHASLALLLQSSLAAGCRDDGAATQPLSVHGASQCRARLMDEPSWSQAESSRPVLDMSLAVPYATVLDTEHEILRVMMSGNETLLMGTLRQDTGQLGSLRRQELEKFVYVTGGHLVSVSVQTINALTNWSLTTSTHRVWRSGRYVPPQLQGGGFEWGPRYLYLPDDSEPFSVTETASLPAGVDGMYGDADSAHAWTSPWGNGRITFISEHPGVAGTLLLRGVVGDSCARMPVVSCPVYTLHDLGTPTLTELSCLQLLAERVVSWNSPAEMEHALFSGEVRGVQVVVPSRGSSSWLHWFSARAEIANLIAEGGLHLIVHEDIELINVLTNWSLTTQRSCYHEASVSPSLQGGGFEQGPPYLYVEGGRRRCVMLARRSSLPAAVDGLYVDSRYASAWTAPWGSGRITFLGPALRRHASITLLLQSSLAAGCRDDGAATQPLSVHGASQCRARLMDEPSWSQAESSRPMLDMSLAVPYATVLDTEHEISTVMMSSNETLLMGTLRQDTGQLGSLRRQELEKFVYVTGGHLVSVSVQTINALTNWSLTTSTHRVWRSGRYVPPQLQGGGFEWGPRYLYLPDDSERFSVTETASLPASVDGMYGDADSAHAWTSPWGNGRITFISEHLGIAGSLLLRGVVGDSCARMPVVSCPVYTLHDLGTSTLTEPSYLQLLAERVVSWNSPAEMEHALFSGEVRGVQFVVPSRGSSSWLDWFSARAEIANLIAEGGLHLIVHEDIELINVLTNWSLTTQRLCYHEATAFPSLQGGGFEQGPQYLYVEWWCFTLARMSSLPAAVDGLYGDAQSAWAWTAPWGSGRITFLGPAPGRHASLALLLQSSLAAGCGSFDNISSTLPFVIPPWSTVLVLSARFHIGDRVHEHVAQIPQRKFIEDMQFAETEFEISRLVLQRHDLMSRGPSVMIVQDIFGNQVRHLADLLAEVVHQQGSHLIARDGSIIQALSNWSVTSGGSCHVVTDPYLLPRELSGGFLQGPRILYFANGENCLAGGRRDSLPTGVDGLYGNATHAYAWTAPWGAGRITFIGAGLVGSLPMGFSQLLRSALGSHAADVFPAVGCPVHVFNKNRNRGFLAQLQLVAEHVVTWDTLSQLEFALLDKGHDLQGVQVVVPSEEGRPLLERPSMQSGEFAKLISHGGLHVIVHESFDWDGIELINVLTNWSLTSRHYCHSLSSGHRPIYPRWLPNLQGGGFEHGPNHVYIDTQSAGHLVCTFAASLPPSVDGAYGVDGYGAYDYSNNAWMATGSAWTAPWGAGRITFVGSSLDPALLGLDSLLQSSLAAGCANASNASHELAVAAASSCPVHVLGQGLRGFRGQAGGDIQRKFVGVDNELEMMKLVTGAQSEHRVVIAGRYPSVVGAFPLSTVSDQLGHLVHQTGAHLVVLDDADLVASLTNWSLRTWLECSHSIAHALNDTATVHLNLGELGCSQVTSVASLPASVDGARGNDALAVAWTSPWGNGRISFAGSVSYTTPVGFPMLLQSVLGTACESMGMVSCPVYVLNDPNMVQSTASAVLLGQGQLLSDHLVPWNTSSEMEEALFGSVVLDSRFQIIFPSQAGDGLLQWFQARSSEIRQRITQGGLHVIVHDVDLINRLGQMSLTAQSICVHSSDWVPGFTEERLYLGNAGCVVATSVRSMDSLFAEPSIYGFSSYGHQFSDSAYVWTAPWGAGRLTFMGTQENLWQPDLAWLLERSDVNASCNETPGEATVPATSAPPSTTMTTSEEPELELTTTRGTNTPATHTLTTSEVELTTTTRGTNTITTTLATHTLTTSGLQGLTTSSGTKTLTIATSSTATGTSTVTLTSTTTATPFYISCGSVVSSSTIGRTSLVGFSSGDAHHKVCLPEDVHSLSRQVILSTCGSAFDTYLRVLDEDGATRGGCDDCGPCGQQAALKIDLSPGACYNVVVEGYGHFEGEYQLEVSCCPADSCGGRGRAIHESWDSTGNRCSCLCHWPFAGETCNTCRSGMLAVVMDGSCKPCFRFNRLDRVALTGTVVAWSPGYVYPSCTSAIHLSFFAPEDLQEQVEEREGGDFDVSMGYCNHSHTWPGLQVTANGLPVGSISCAPQFQCPGTAVQSPGPETAGVLVVLRLLDGFPHTSAVSLSLLALLASIFDSSISEVLIRTSSRSLQVAMTRAMLPAMQDFLNQELESQTLIRCDAGEDVQHFATATLELVVLVGQLCGSTEAVLQSLVPLTQLARPIRILHIGEATAPAPGFLTSVSSFGRRTSASGTREAICQHLGIWLHDRRQGPGAGCNGPLSFSPSQVSAFQRDRLTFQGVCKIRSCCIGSKCSNFVHVDSSTVSCRVPLLEAGRYRVSVVSFDGESHTSDTELVVTVPGTDLHVARPVRSSSVLHGVFPDVSMSFEYRHLALPHSATEHCCDLVALDADLRVMGRIGPRRCNDDQASIPQAIHRSHSPIRLLAWRCYAVGADRAEGEDGKSCDLPGASASIPETPRTGTAQLLTADDRIDHVIQAAVTAAAVSSDSSPSGQGFRAVRQALEAAELKSSHPSELRSQTVLEYVFVVLVGYFAKFKGHYTSQCLRLNV